MPKRWCWLPALVLGTLLAGGCEEDVTAVVGTDRPFSLYGVLTPQADTQWVWVFPVEGTLVPTAEGPLDARLESVDLETGERRRWRDSLLLDPAGRAAHVFWTPLAAAYDHTYRLTATRSDGNASRVEVTVPPRAALELGAPALPFFQPVLVRTRAPRLLKVHVTYHVKYTRGPDARTTLRLPFTYDRLVEPTPEGWAFLINLGGDQGEIVKVLEALRLLDSTYGLVLLEMTVDLIVAADVWAPPDSLFDPEVLVQPGTMTNVENGYGFVGAGFRLQHQWLPPDFLRRAAGFR